MKSCKLSSRVGFAVQTHKKKTSSRATGVNLCMFTHGSKQLLKSLHESWMGKILSYPSIIMFVLALSLISSSYALSVQSHNLVTNPSFELQGEGAPVGWAHRTWAGKAVFDHTAKGRTSSRSVDIISSEGADASWSQIVKVKPGAKYKLAAWIKTQDLKTTSGRGAQLNIHELQSVRTRAIKGTSDWTKVETTFLAQGNESLTLNCLFGGWGLATGKAWFDDVSINEIPNEPYVPKTVNTSVEINADKTFEPISKYIYGQFIEHLGRCIYGGIWAEMLEDRKFYFPVPARRNIWRLTGAQARVLAASPWKVIGSADNVSMAADNPYSGSQDVQVKVFGPEAGIYQEDLGLVSGKEYEGRIVIAGDKSAAPIMINLAWGDEKNQKQTFRIKSISDDYKTVEFELKAGADSDNGRLEIVSAGKGSFRIGAVSLMPADNIRGFRADTLEMMKKLDSPVYRWPGGNFVSGYDWRDGLGDRNKRPTRTNPAWTGIETNDVGIDEFIELCRLLQTEPMICVNTGFGDQYSAADEVEYCNGSADTRMGKRRARYGNPKPFDVKWWCVGNEMFGSWQLGYMSLNHYVLKHNLVEAKMREVDPDIVTIGVGAVGNWSEGMLRSCADNMDVISEHFYTQTRPDLIAHTDQVTNKIKEIADAHRRYRETIPSLKGKDIRIAMDEWNYWYGPHVFGELGTRYFMKDALGIARGLHEYFRNSDIYIMANYAQTVNVIGCIKTTKTEAGLAATALPLIMYRKHFGTIPVDVSKDAYPLDISAAWTDSKDALTIGIVNPTLDTYKLDINIDNAKISATADAWQVANPDPMAYNEPGKKPNISIEKVKDVNLSKTIEIEPVSMILFKAETK